MRDLVGNHLFKAEQQNFIEAQKVNKTLTRNLLLSKIFYRWRLNIERSLSESNNKKWAAERKVIRDQLRELKLRSLEVNKMENEYLKVGFDKGYQIVDKIKNIQKQFVNINSINK